uniref:Ubiquitin-like protease family profile domain-containing protein n=1 Tax=Lactuca sativa TaxID=4236 RepID=A0A9R1V7P3_LACSA|nr:hypothetical protein LSAT_V11C600314540 [Lactuca sativa]
MVHLISHIVQEIKACGPVFLRYMYPFERYIGILKGYVRNRNQPEGSIVEGYTCEEVIEFCQGYMKDVESVGVPKTCHSGRLEGKGGVGCKINMPTYEELQVAHLVVLKHMKCLTPYVDEHMDMLKLKYPGKEKMWYINNHNKEFSSWLEKKVAETDVDETVKRLGRGPDCRVKSYQGYAINGYTFYTKDQDEKSVQVDKDGFTLVDLSSNGYVSEPFVLAKHVTHVFYIKDPSKKKEHIVLQGKRRIISVGDVVDEEEYDHFDDLPPFSVGIEPGNYDNIECTTFVRSNIEVHDESWVCDLTRRVHELTRRVHLVTSLLCRLQSIPTPSIHRSGLLMPALHVKLLTLGACKVMTECELLVNVADTQLIVANGIAWPTSETVIHSQPISTGCVKVQVDEIVKIYENLPVHAVTQTEEVEYVKHLLHTIVQWPRYAISKSNSGTGMGSNRASPHIHVDDIMTTSVYRPQFEENHIAYQHEINEHFQGGLVDMMLSMNPPQVHLNAPEPRARPEPESEFESEIESESESESETEPEPEFVTHDEPELFTSLSKLQEQRPQIQSVGFQVVEFFGNANVVNIFSPKGMYRRRVQITIQYIEVLQLFLRDWLDQSVIHWFAMLLFRSPNSECAFFDPLCIARLDTKTDLSPVTKHIEEVFSYHKGKRYFLAPYLQGMHWLLFILCSESKCGYILDSLCEKNQEKKKDAYHFPSFIDNVFLGRVNK